MEPFHPFHLSRGKHFSISFNSSWTRVYLWLRDVVDIPT